MAAKSVLFVPTHAVLLGNGQAYATLAVQYYRVSRIFMSRNFHPCKLVPQIHVMHFPPLQHGAAFSCPASSCLAFSASSIDDAFFMKIAGMLMCNAIARHISRLMRVVVHEFQFITTQ